VHAVHRMDTITLLITISTFLTLVEPAVPVALAPVALAPVALAPVKPAPVALALVIKIGKL
jgi:hypothetical protein